MEKTVNHKAWFLVLPVFLIVAFSAILPLMTVVNYSVQDTFGNNHDDAATGNRAHATVSFAGRSAPALVMTV